MANSAHDNMITRPIDFSWGGVLLTKKRPKCYCNMFYKTRAILIKLGTLFPEWICCQNIQTSSGSPESCLYTTLWNCEMFVRHVCYHWVVTERNSRIYPISAVAPKFARFKSSWLQCVRTIARENIQNTHHWSGRTKTVDNIWQYKHWQYKHIATVTMSIQALSILALRTLALRILALRTQWGSRSKE